MRARDQSLDQRLDTVVHHIVVGALPGIPQLQPGLVQVTRPEQDQPAGLSQFGGPDPLQVVATHLGEDRHSPVAVDLEVVSGVFP